MDSDSDLEVLTPPEMREVAKNIELNLLPKKSCKKYEGNYKRFMDYCMEKNAKTVSENVLIAYFAELSKTMKSSTLWSVYSMLKATMNVKNSVDIGRYLKLPAYLKRASEGYKAKKSRVFEKKDITNFILDAPDDDYLLAKVVLIFGIAGACRCDELLNLKSENIEDMDNKLLVTFLNTKTKNSRTFIVMEYLDVVRKYISLRPAELKDTRFFFKYAKGKSVKQFVGIHKFGSIPQEIAVYLKLPNAKEYTGHCLRRTSATLLINSGGDITMLKRHGGWKSSTIAEGYIEDSIASKTSICEKNLTNVATTYDANETNNIVNMRGTIAEERKGGLFIQNFSNFTVNVNNN